jgi:hypothetical protein
MNDDKGGANLTDPRYNIPTVAVFLPVVGKEGGGRREETKRRLLLTHHVSEQKHTDHRSLTHGVTSTSIACPLMWDLNHFNVTRDSG